MILSFNGTEVGQLHDLPRLVAGTSPDTDATMTVWRNGQNDPAEGESRESSPTSKLPRPMVGEDEEQPMRAEALGMHFAPLTSQLRRELHVAKDMHVAWWLRGSTAGMRRR